MRGLDYINRGRMKGVTVIQGQPRGHNLKSICQERSAVAWGGERQRGGRGGQRQRGPGGRRGRGRSRARGRGRRGRFKRVEHGLQNSFLRTGTHS